MSQFLEDLMTSIFTPGPTSALLLATNVAFASLSSLLLLLLAFTRSVHFLILSILSGALWWSINWFAREVRLAQEREDKTLREDEDARTVETEGDIAGDELSTSGGDGDDGDGDETEVEATQKRAAAARGQMKPPPRTSSVKATASGRLISSTSSQNDAARQRQQRRNLAESTGSLSTDSEWEKVEDER